MSWMLDTINGWLDRRARRRRLDRESRIAAARWMLHLPPK